MLRRAFRLLQEAEVLLGDAPKGAKGICPVDFDPCAIRPRHLPPHTAIKMIQHGFQKFLGSRAAAFIQHQNPVSRRPDKAFTFRHLSRKGIVRRQPIANGQRRNTRQALRLKWIMRDLFLENLCHDELLSQI
jgi:hypothetical protein